LSFNLQAPPHFRGLDEYRPLKRYERNLPHWRQDGATYFVTFHFNDALPANKQRQIQSLREEWERKHPPPRTDKCWIEYAKTVFELTEKMLDAGFGDCWFRQTLYAEELQRSLLHFHQAKYDLGCFVIMVNHCHLTMRPFDGFELEDEVGAIKRTTSRFINQHEQIAGPLWQQECYDRIIRDEEHLYRVVQYIGNNPRKANVPEDQWQRWMNPDWEAAGWGFAT
jgi:putative transposase